MSIALDDIGGMQCVGKCTSALDQSVGAPYDISSIHIALRLFKETAQLCIQAFGWLRGYAPETDRTNTAIL